MDFSSEHVEKLKRDVRKWDDLHERECVKLEELKKQLRQLERAENNNASVAISTLKDLIEKSRQVSKAYASLARDNLDQIETANSLQACMEQEDDEDDEEFDEKESSDKDDEDVKVDEEESGDSEMEEIYEEEKPMSKKKTKKKKMSKKELRERQIVVASEVN